MRRASLSDRPFGDIVRDNLSGVYLDEDNLQFYPFQIVNGPSTGGNVPVGSSFTTEQRFQTGSLSWTHTLRSCEKIVPIR